MMKKMLEQYIQQLLTTIQIDPFYGPARNVRSGLEISSKIINGLLAAKETGEKLHLEFVKNRVTSQNASFFETIKRSGITYKEDKRKTQKAVSLLKEDRQAPALFVSECTNKKAAFHYPQTLYPLAIADPSGKIYQPTAKHLFRNELIKLSCDSIEKNPPKNVIHIYDGMAIVRSVASQKAWGDLWRLLLSTQPLEGHIIFDNYTDNQVFSVKQTKRVSRAAGEGKRLHIGNGSQEMLQVNDYKEFLKNNLSKADLIRRFSEFVK